MTRKLRWTPDQTTEWDGSTYRLRSQSTQDSKGTWGKYRWFLWTEPLPGQPGDDSPLTGSLGARTARARLLAELHLVHGYSFAFQVRPEDGVELWQKPGGELRPLDELLVECGLMRTKKAPDA